MKIGLLTYHHTTNFGSLLQTYALYKAVENTGNEIEIIDYHNETIENRESPIRLSDIRSVRHLVRYFIREPQKRKKEKSFKEFLNKNTKLSNSCTTKNIARICERYDKVLVGSDLVWDFTINGNDTTYFLDFLPDCSKKIAYASSVGSVWQDKEKVSSMLRGFSHIGVRERVIEQTLTEWLNKPVDFVCDPTMLVHKAFWKNMASKPVVKGKYIICYFYDSKKQIYKDALEYGKKHNLPVYLITYGKAPEGIKAVAPADVEDFLSLIANADTVFTASYHGLLFSLYFNRNFYYYNRGWKARMDSVAEYLNIQNREQLSSVNINTKPDFKLVNKQIQQFRQSSLDKLSLYLDS